MWVIDGIHLRHTYKVDKADNKEFDKSLKSFLNTLDNTDITKPIVYSKQGIDDYENTSLEFKEGLEQPNETGFAMHSEK